jgi:hypothetical protein
MEESMVVFMEVFRGLRLVVDLRRVEWERRLEEGMDISDERDWNGMRMGMINGLAWCLCMGTGVSLLQDSALG